MADGVVDVDFNLSLNKFKSDYSDIKDMIDKLTKDDHKVDIDVQTKSGSLDKIKNTLNEVPKTKEVEVNAKDNASKTTDKVRDSIEKVPNKKESTMEARDNASDKISKVKEFFKSIPSKKLTEMSIKDNATSALTGIQKGYQGVEGAAEKAKSTMMSILEAVGVMKAVELSVDAVKSSLDKAFTRIDVAEQFTRTMTTMTGSTDQVSQALDTMKENIKGTAYGLDTTSKAVQGFVTSGIGIQDATQYVKDWGNAVSFYGDGSDETYGRVAYAMQQMSATGKVSMDQLNTLMDSGIPVLQIYAEKTGKSVQDVSADISAGKLSATDFLQTMDDAFNDGAGKFASISNASKEAGASWGATFDNMKAATARGVQSIIQSIDDGLQSNGLGSMRSQLADLGSFAEKTLDSMSGSFTKVGVAIGKFATGHEKDFQSLGNSLGRILKSIGDVAWTLFSKMLDGLGGIIHSVSKYLDGFSKSLEGAIKGHMGDIDKFASAVGQLLKAFGSTAWSIFSGIIEEIGKHVGEAAKGFEDIGGIISDALLSHQKEFNDLGKSLGDIVSAIGDVAWKVFSSIIKEVGKHIGGVAEGFSKLGKAIADYLVAHADDIGSIAGSLADIAYIVGEAAWELFSDTLQVIGDMLGLTAKNAKDANDPIESVKNILVELTKHKKEIKATAKIILTLFAVKKALDFAGAVGDIVGQFKDLRKTTKGGWVQDLLNSGSGSSGSGSTPDIDIPDSGSSGEGSSRKRRTIFSPKGKHAKGYVPSASEMEQGSKELGSATKSLSRTAKNAAKTKGFWSSLAGGAGKMSKFLRGVDGIQVALAAVDIGVAATSGSKKTKGTRVGKATGTGVGGIAGGAAGAAIGTAIAPGIGTAIGGLVGGYLGSVGGEKIGSALGGAIQRGLQKMKMKPPKVDAKMFDKAGVSLANSFNKAQGKISGSLNKISKNGYKMNASIKKDTDKSYRDMIKSADKYYKDNVKQSKDKLKKELENGKISKKQYDTLLKADKKYYKSKSDNMKKSVKDQQKVSDKYYKDSKKLTEKQEKEMSKLKSKYNKASGKEKEELGKQIKKLESKQYDDRKKLYNNYSKNLSKAQKSTNKNSEKNISDSEKRQSDIFKRASKQRIDDAKKEYTEKVNTAKKEHDKVVDNANKTEKDSVEAADRKYKNTVDKANDEYYNKGTISKDEYDKIVGNAKKEHDDSVKEAKAKRDKTVAHADSQYKETVNRAKKQKDEDIKKAKQETSGVGRVWSDFTGAISGIWGKISGAWSNLMGMFGGGGSRKHAKGLNSFNPNDGHMAVVGEEGFELAHTPGMGIYPIGADGEETRFIPPMTSILPHEKSVQMLRGASSPDDLSVTDFARMAIGLPHYAKGKNSNVLADLWNAARNTFGNFGGMIMNGINSVWDWFKSATRIDNLLQGFDTTTVSGMDRVSHHSYNTTKDSVFNVFGGMVKSAQDGLKNMVKGFDTGGYFNKESFIRVAENGNPEYVINAKNDNADELLEAALLDRARQDANSPIAQAIDMIQNAKTDSPEEHFAPQVAATSLWQNSGLAGRIAQQKTDQYTGDLKSNTVLEVDKKVLGKAVVKYGMDDIMLAIKRKQKHISGKG